ncbi:MAG TPA: asparagine--tRNA ligase [Rhodothermales bacterium]|nr:asparagine--tRNA ligase [Rhodothermales bacterium]
MQHDFVYIRDLASHDGQIVTLKGWLYNKRSSKGLHFLILRDGTGLAQCVITEQEVGTVSWAAAEDATQESSLVLKGLVRKDDRQIGGYELVVHEAVLMQRAEGYPITPKDHGIEFLMDQRHLWLRSQRPWATMRLRNNIIMSIHHYFQEQGFIQMDAPIFTGNAVEGTSTLFEVDYFDEKAYLTQSGQLYGEAMAMALGKIYTFGPTFRAEKSKTRRHLTEFWMIEPEMAFYDLAMNMDMAEGLLRRILRDARTNCGTELDILGRDVALLEKADAPFPRIHYSDAVDLLKSNKSMEMLDGELEAAFDEEKNLRSELAEIKKNYGSAKKWEKKKFDAREIEINQLLEDCAERQRNLPKWKASAIAFEWGNDLGGSDETVLTKHFDTPIMVHRYPAAVKAFYMKRDPEDDRLALGVDVLAPEGYGEIIGGGERATDLQFLLDQIRAHGLPESAFSWYLDLRRFGSVPHSGFGLGLERTICWVGGLKHVREAIPFARLMSRLSP